MKKWMVVAFMLLASHTCMASDVHWVRGDISAIKGNDLTVDGTIVTVSDDTVVESAGKKHHIDVLTVKDNITARFENGAVVLIEVHGPEFHVHGNGDAPNPQ